MKTSKIAAFLFLLSILFSHAQEKSESVAIDKLIMEIGKLDSQDLVQEASRSKADACALKVKFGYPTDDPPGEEIMMLQLSDLDENEIDIEYNEENDEWDLSVYCNDLDDRVLVMDESYGDTYESMLMVTDRNKQVLVQLKEKLIDAIRECKARKH